MNTVQVYPVPASEHVTILLNTNMRNPWAAMLYNSMGNLVMNMEAMVSNGSSLIFSVAALDEGIYFLDIKSNFGQLRERIIIS